MLQISQLNLKHKTPMRIQFQVWKIKEWRTPGAVAHSRYTRNETQDLFVSLHMTGLLGSCFTTSEHRIDECQDRVYVRGRPFLFRVSPDPEAWESLVGNTDVMQPAKTQCVYTPERPNNQTQTTERFRLNADRVNAFTPRAPSSINAWNCSHPISNAFYCSYHESLSL